MLSEASSSRERLFHQRIDEKCKETYIKDIPLSLAVGTAIKNNTNEDLAEILKEAKSFESETHYAGMQNVAQRNRKEHRSFSIKAKQVERFDLTA